MARLVVPDDVLEAVASTPEVWPVILETVGSMRRALTGDIQVKLVDGELRELTRGDSLKFGRALNLPDGLTPVCPVEGCGLPLRAVDYANRLLCPPCDILYTVWDIKRRAAFRPAHDGAAAF